MERLGAPCRLTAMHRPLGVLLATASLLVGCAALAPSGDLDGEWILRSGSHDGRQLALVADRGVTLRIEGGEIGGSAACNIYGGTMERDGSAVRIGAVSMTEMGCDEPTMALEAAYLAALVDVTSAERADGRLVLSGPNVELAFTLAVPEPDASLVGTRWTLESLTSGDAVASVMGDAFLELAEDGTLRGTTGCRALDGRYTLDGDELRVTNLIVEELACEPETAAQDAQVLDVLGGRVHVAIDGTRLSLRATEVGLDYLAGS